MHALAELDAEGLIKGAVQVLFVLIWIFSKFFSGSKGKTPDRKSPDKGRPAPKPEAPRAPPATVQRAPARPTALIDQLQRIQARVAALEPALASARDGIRALGSRGRLLHSLLEEHVAPVILGAPARLTARRRALEAGPPSPAAESTWQQDVAALARADQRLVVLAELISMRVHPEQGPFLADADAIAAALLRPLQEFSADHGIGFPALEVVTAPAHRDAQSVWTGLLPAGHPLVLVPEDMADDLLHWAGLAHEVGHIVHDQTPGMAAEVAEKLGLTAPPRLLVRTDTGIQGSLRQPLSAWRDELFADLMTALFLGPAALYGFLHVFAQPDEPEAVLTIGVRGDRYAPHPPAHLRVRLMVGVLEHLGFTGPVRGALQRWDTLHGFDERPNAELAPLALRLPVAGAGLVSVPVERVEGVLLPALIGLLDAQLHCLKGHALTGLPGLEMSPPLWRRVEGRAADLLAGRAFRAAGDVALAAALLARHQRPQDVSRIEAGVRQAVLGKDTALTDKAERQLRDAAPAAAAGGPRRELLDALILQQVLSRRPGLAPRRGPPGPPA